MRFFDWLFGKGWDEPEKPIVVDEGHGPRVPKWCKAGKAGKRIICPSCGGTTHVYNFSWDALRCQFCKETIDKYDWFLAAGGKQ
tara:strand:+ start:2553 stop:2804 length:252 start_codon:yes stop_codon:yes gene_type:complete